MIERVSDVVLKRVNDSLLALLIVVALLSPLLGYIYPVAVTWGLLVFVISFKKVFSLSQKEMFVVMMMVYLYLTAEKFTFRLFWHICWYDKVLHFVTPFMGVILVYNMLAKYDLKNIFLISVCVIMGMGASFEVIEYSYDFIMKEGMQGVYDANNNEVLNISADTNQDMLFNLFGTISGASIARVLRKKKVID